MVTIQKIVVAYDTSEQAARGFEIGVDLARKYSAELIVISVVRPPEPPEMVETEAILENGRAFYEEHFGKLRESVVDSGVKTRFEVLVGHPADKIINFANEEAANVIIMGHRGKSRLKRWLLGSMSKRVVSYAHCSVLIVR
jgi:nucleotide-binding universal stress UspA family protein